MTDLVKDTTFSELGLSDKTLRALDDLGYKHPTAIQAQAIPYVLRMRDVMGLAQTGTGKTAGFVLPMIEILAGGRARARMPRSLILAPTRELAAQIQENFQEYGKYHDLKTALLVGGVSLKPQIRRLEKGVDVLIATPGRLLDLFERGRILLTDIKIFVTDEADRMLDMGFIPDLERIGSLLPKMRQTLMFSATMPKGVRKFADQFLSNPKEIIVSTQSSAADNVDHYVVNTHPKKKLKTLRRLLDELNVDRALIFCNRKKDIGSVRRSLGQTDYTSLSLHGDLSQKQRSETLEKMHAGEVDILVCSDVAARGLDIDDLNFVFNFDVPNNADSYVHRIGRTGRASEKGMAITLATNKDKRYLQAVEELIGETIPPLSQRNGSEKTGSDKKDDEDTKKTHKKSGKKSSKKSSQTGKESQDEKSPGQRQESSLKKNGRKAESVIELDQPGRRTTNEGKIIGFGGDAPSFLLKEFKKIG